MPNCARFRSLFFWLYGIAADDAQYILGTFPIVREQDTRAFGHYRTEADILALLPLLGDPMAAAVPAVATA